MHFPNIYSRVFSILCTLFVLGHSAVKAQVTADFSSDVVKGCAPLTVNFRDLSSTSGASYRWVFGNGNQSTLQNPQAIYYLPGTYEVSLTVTDPTNQSNTLTRKGYITVFKNPQADFSADVLSGCAALGTSFRDRSSKGDGDLESFRWDFGDGNVLDGGSIAPHTYDIHGKFTISLELTDKNGCKDKAVKSQYIEVKERPKVQMLARESFSCVVPFKAEFTGYATGAGTHTFFWEFGDGNTSTQQNPEHTYTTESKFNVSLTVTASNGCKRKETTNGMIVTEGLKPDFSLDKVTGCAPFKPKITAHLNMSHPKLEYEWDLGNGTTSKLKDPVVTYDKDGLYTVSLKVSVDGKCQATVNKSGLVQVLKGPEAKFDVNDTFACDVPARFVFTNKSTGAVTYSWRYSAGFTDSRDLVYDFTSFNDHKVQLIAVNAANCQDTFERMIKVKDPEPRIVADPASGCEPLTVKFRDASFAEDGIIRRVWYFPNGDSVANMQELSRTFADSGTYTVRLKIISGNGCERFATETIRVGKKTNPLFEPKKDTICNKQLLQFKNTTNSNVEVHGWLWKIGEADFSTEKDGRLEMPLDTGWHNVSLYAFNNGCQDSFVLENQVYVLPPKAEYKLTQDSCNQSVIALKDQSLKRQGSQVTWWLNGTKYTSNVVEAVLPKGRHYLKLLVVDPGGRCRDSLEDEIVVDRETIADFGLPSSGCAPTQVSFSNASVGDLLFRWDFGNGQTSVHGSPKVVYDKSGIYTVKLLAFQREFPQCRDSISKEIVISGPSVEGSITGPEACPPVNIRLVSLSRPQDFASLYWQINEPGGVKQIPVDQTGTLSHSLLSPGPGPNGSWNISLVGMDSNGCIGRSDFTHVVKGLTQVSLRLGQFAECTGRRYTFAVRLPIGTDGSKMKFQWNFGDGTISDLAAQGYTYAQSGLYPVSLKVTDTLGCTSEYRDTIDVEGRKLKAALVADQTSTNCPPFLVNFFEQSLSESRRIVSYEWDFGDGSRSVLRNPKHNYVTAGKFTVRLKIKDEWGCEDSVVYKDLILVKGPRGIYQFDKKEGCVPLTVRFDAQTEGSSKMEWDMGDGNVIRDSLTYTHVYQDTGRYIPLLILSDSFGCTYTLPPIDTINVRPFPVPLMDFSTPCAGKEIRFSNASQQVNGIELSCNWDFGDGNGSDECTLRHVYARGGTYDVRLNISNQFGCSASKDSVIRVQELRADFEPEYGTACVGLPFKLIDRSKSDTTIIEWNWHFSNNDQDTGSVIWRLYDNIGPVPVTYIVGDITGCRDTLISLSGLVVGDTLPPLLPDPLRITVEGDFQLRFDHVPSNIADFKRYHYWMDRGNGFEWLSTNSEREESSLFVDGVNTLHQVYCMALQVENTCSKVSVPDTLRKHCSIDVIAQGDTNAAHVNWSPYIGWNAVRSYEVLREDRSRPGEYFLIDTVSGAVFNYTDTTIECRAEHRYRIRAHELMGYAQYSYSDTAHAIPIWVHTVPPNEVVTATVRHDEYVHLVWDSTPSPRVPIVAYVLQKTGDGMRWTYPEQHHFTPSERSVDDREVSVDDRSYFYRMMAIDACGDSSDWSNIGKTILLHADTTEFERPFVYWSHYADWEEGIASYEVQRVEPDGSFTSLGVVSAMDTVFIDQVSDLIERSSYCYRVIAYRNVQESGDEQVVSISNIDCAPVRSRIYVPNAFTPNGDGLNETFLVKGMYIKEYTLRIYNRWGEKVYESNSMFSSWNGAYATENRQLGVYVYVIDALGVDGVAYHLKGNVHLVR